MSQLLNEKAVKAIENIIKNKGRAEVVYVGGGVQVNRVLRNTEYKENADKK